MFGFGGRRGVQKVRVAEFAVRSYLALLAAGYVVLSVVLCLVAVAGGFAVVEALK